jgi:hypothetical protein
MKYGDVLTMRMNSDQEGQAGKLVAEIQAWVAPALPGALCAAFCGITHEIIYFNIRIGRPPERADFSCHPLFLMNNADRRRTTGDSYEY